LTFKGYSLKINRVIAYWIRSDFVGAEIVNLNDEIVKQNLLDISIKIADALEMIENAKEVVAKSEGLLIKAQLELENIFLSLDV